MVRIVSASARGTLKEFYTLSAISPMEKITSRLIACILIFCFIGCRPADRKPNIIIILVDTLRADHLGVYGYQRPTSPNIDKFGAESHVFNHAYSTAPWTIPSVASLFTGLYPSAHGVAPRLSKNGENEETVPTISERAVVLAETLKLRGYSTLGLSANAWITKELGFWQGFDFFETFDYANADFLNGEAIKAVDKYRSSDKPFILYLHYMDPHTPCDVRDEYMNSILKNDTVRSVNESYDKEVKCYDSEIRFVDHYIGRFFQFLKDRSIYDDSIIIFTADHGEAFSTGGSRGHGHDLADDQIQIPLIIKAPRTQFKEEGVASLVDVYPTVLDILGLKDETGHLQGMSLLDTATHSPSIVRNQGIISEAVKSNITKKAFISPSTDKIVLDLKQVGLHSLYIASAREDSTSSTTTKKQSATASQSEYLKLLTSFLEIYQQSLSLQDQFSTDPVPLTNEKKNVLRTLGYISIVSTVRDTPTAKP